MQKIERGLEIFIIIKCAAISSRNKNVLMAITVFLHIRSWNSTIIIKNIKNNSVRIILIVPATVLMLSSVPMRTAKSKF